MNALQLETIDLNLIFITSYFILLIIKPTAARLKVFAAVLICVLIIYSPLYDLLNNTQYYSLFTLIYILACLNITNKKVSSTCCIMAIFEFLMIIDRYVNAGIETWVYIYFEEITLIIHSLIISSFFKWKYIRWRECMGSMLNYMRGLLHDVRHASCLCYDRVIKKKW